MLRVIVCGFLFSVLLSTTGCTSAAVAVLDEKMSQMTDKECTSVNIMLGEDYCKPKRNEIKQEQVYCYRTLGGVDCYSEKSPYSTPSPRVRSVSELGSTGAKVETVSQKKDDSPFFSWMTTSKKLDTAELD
ncbi:hypothetical protein [Sneathiella limimaris]|uniref:hypothetical protein n=1 Tax=Sneathiella limimaris TaxID=1964213 RepID=UPI00146A62FF|nr:hypothetical protein [Sneathiella limimaris]